MIFGFFTLFVALVISAVAAYYSIVGLTAIFSAAVVPIVIMGAALEVGKLTAAVWLKMNWARANLTYKLYLVPAVAFLMLLTSMGIFGFLSKAHSDQNLVSGDVLSKIAIYDDKIKTARENIDANRKALGQMDEAVDQVMGRSTSETGADKAVALRRTQQKERGRLLAEIEAEQKKISEINEERAPIAAEVRKVEAEVGPIKYIAALIYDENADTGMLEKAVRLVIILIVLVFDPLALVLILAAQQSLRWHREDQLKEKTQDVVPVSTQETETEETETEEIEDEATEPLPPNWPFPEHIPSAYEPDDGPLTQEQIDQIRKTVSEYTEKHDAFYVSDVLDNDTLPMNWEPESTVDNTPPVEKTILEQHPYLSKHFVHFQNTTPMVYTPEVLPDQEPTENVVDVYVTEVLPEAESVPPTIPFYKLLGNGYVEVEGKTVHSRVLADLYPEVAEDIALKKLDTDTQFGLQADNEVSTSKPSHATFGVEFPKDPIKGEMFLQVGTLPSKLYKFNGSNWIAIDKLITDSYTYNEEYLQYIIDSINKGHLSPDDLTVGEQEQITEYLKKNA